MTQLDERKHIAETIRRARLAKGWQVQEAAAKVGIGASNWSRWETATSTPRPAMLLRIGELLGLPDGWMTPAATLSDPVSIVTPDQLLERINAERLASERRIQAMLEEYLGNGGNDEQRRKR